MKNWQAISTIDYLPLRRIIAFSDGEFERALALEMPKYYFHDDAHCQQLTRDGLIRLLVAAHSRTEVDSCVNL